VARVRQHAEERIALLRAAPAGRCRQRTRAWQLGLRDCRARSGPLQGQREEAVPQGRLGARKQGQRALMARRLGRVSGGWAAYCIQAAGNGGRALCH
jgi:hypothetical protein